MEYAALAGLGAAKRGSLADEDWLGQSQRAARNFDSPPIEARRRAIVVARASRILLLGLPLLLYSALPTRNFYWDGVAFAIDIEQRLPGAQLIHPSHLVYALWGSWLYRLGETVGIHTRALFILQAANSVLAGLCVILFYKCLRLRDVPAGLSIVGALLFGFSATWWRFAVDANAYVPSIFFLLCAYLLVGNPRTTVPAGFAHAGAMLFHELAFLFLPVALLSLHKSRRSISAYAAAALSPVVAAYAFAYTHLRRDKARVPLVGDVAFA